MKPGKNAPLKHIQAPSHALSSLKGVGPKRAAMLSLKGLRTLLDLLFFMPIRYEDRNRITPIGLAEENRPALVRGKVLFGREEQVYPSRRRLYKILLKDGTGSLELLWFSYKKPYLNSLARPDLELFAFGKMTRNRGLRQMVHPDVTMAD
ncbi:MAG: hypothetical protein ABII06_19860, partial [Pseudomonadota bacterium]